MKKPLNIHPFLFAIFPVLFLFSHNIRIFPLSVIYIPIAISVFFMLLFWCIFAFIFKDIKKAALLISLSLLLFFSYGHIYNIIKNFSIAGFAIGRHRYVFCIWITIYILIMRLFLRITKNVDIFTKFFNVTAVILVMFSFVRIVTGEIEAGIYLQFSDRSKNIVADTVNTEKIIAPPNIYYIILDSYAGENVFKAICNYDNTEFYNYLKKKGFYIANKSKSNYHLSRLSLSSALNFTYLDKTRTKIDDLLKYNKVFHFLKLQGYKIVVFENSETGIDLKRADIYIKQGWYLSEFQQGIINMTPISIPLYKIGSSYMLQKKRTDNLYIFDHLADMCKFEGPIFVYAHITLAHPPYVFNEKGEPIQPDREFSLNDADWLIVKRSKLDEHIGKYKEQITFINKKLKTTIDKIISNSDKPPIIILQGDHGPKLTPVLESSNQTHLAVYFPILNAYYLPGDLTIYLHNKISPVNTFRVIFNHYFGTNYKLLSDKSYFCFTESSFEFIDVTENNF